MVYGPPQFTEADVLACVAEQSEKASKNDSEEEKENSQVKTEVEDEEMKNEDEENAPGDADEDDVETLKAKVKKLETNNKKCSKCMVSKNGLL